MISNIQEYILPETIKCESRAKAAISGKNAETETQKSFLLNNIGILQVDEKRGAYHDFVIPRGFDIIYDLSSNVPFELIVGGNRVNPTHIKYIILIATVYSEFKIRFYLSKDVEKFYIKYQGVYLEQEARKKLVKHDGCLSSGELLYTGGICGPIKKHDDYEFVG